MPVLVNALPSSREMHVRLDWIGALIDRESDGEELILVPQAEVLFDEVSRSSCRSLAVGDCFCAGNVGRGTASGEY